MSHYKILLEETEKVTTIEYYGKQFPVHPEEWEQEHSFWQEDYARFLLQKDIGLLTIYDAKEDLSCLWEGRFATMHDVYVTDPPYNVAYEGKTKAALTIPNDNLDDQAFQTFLVDAFHNVDQYLKAGGVFYIWHADKERLAFSTALQQVGWLEKQALIWVKDSFVLGRQDYQWQHEPCLYGWKPGASHYFVSDFSQSTILESQLETKSKRELIALIKTYQANQPTSILRVNRPTKNEEHPTMKPIALLERFIRSSSRRGDCVLDTFAGSGSTLLACERLGRKSYSMELEPKYVERILTRFQQETGQAPIKLNKEE